MMIRIEGLQDDLNKFKMNLQPLIDDSLILVKKLNSISEKVEGNILVGRSVIEKVKEIADNVAGFERRITNRIEMPLMDTINTFAAVIKGIKVFYEKVKSKEPDIPRIKSKKDEQRDDAIYFSDEINEQYNDINKELNEVRKKLEEMKKV